MEPEQWQHVCTLFESVLELPIEDRRAFIDDLRDEPLSIRTELASLLDQHEDDTPTILSLGMELGDPAAPEPAPLRPNGVDRCYADLRRLGRLLIHRVTGQNLRSRKRGRDL